MSSGYAFLLLLFLLLPVQTPRDSIQLHYEKAETLRRSGNLSAAEAEYAAILGEAYYKLGRVRLAQSNFAGAVEALEAATGYGTPSDQLLVDLAIAYFQNEQYEKALDPLQRVVAHASNNVGAYHMLGKTYFMLGNFEQAGASLQQALRLAPNDYDVSYTLGLAYLKERQIEAATRIYDRMFQKLGDRPQLHVLVGRAYRETGFLSEAIAEFNKAANLDPKFPRVHYYLGLTYLLKDGVNRLDEAEGEFKVELAAHPQEFFANYYLGITATVERNWQVAIEYLEKASQIQPDNPDPYFFIGQAFQGVGKHEQAIAAFKKSIALNPNLKHNDYQVSNAHYRLGQSLLKLGFTTEGAQETKIASDLKSVAFKRDEAKIQAFTATEGSRLSELVAPEGLTAEAPVRDTATLALLQKETDFCTKVIAGAHNNIGSLRAERQDFRAAAEQFKLASKWDPQLEGLNFNWGLACYKAELYPEALLPLENDLKAHPQSIATKQLLGLSYFMTDNYARASALLTEVVAAKPNEAALYYPLALSLINEQKTDEANHFIQQMVTLGANSPQLHILLGRAAYDQGDSVTALEELQSARALDNKVLLAHFYSGVIYLKLGKFAEAEKEFEAELGLNPHDWQAKYDLAYVWLANQERERGIALMREVSLSKPEFADAHYELGKALLQKGDVPGAIGSLEAALKLEPGAAHIHYQLGRAYMAAGRKTEGEAQLEASRQLKEKERKQTNP
jgi:tetratricopeptide (TPR) repeat protein